MSDDWPLPILAHPLDWWSDAECKGRVDVMFDWEQCRDTVERYLRLLSAVSICGDCPVFADCERFAERDRPVAGVWAGRPRGARHADMSRPPSAVRVHRFFDAPRTTAEVAVLAGMKQVTVQGHVATLERLGAVRVAEVVKPAAGRPHPKWVAVPLPKTNMKEAI